jgi:hypothetical protein
MHLGRERMESRSPSRIQLHFLLHQSPQIGDLAALSIHYTDFMNTTTSPSNPQRASRMGRLVAGSIGLVVVFIGLAFLGHLFPKHEGSEFSPFSFGVRQFHIRRWPRSTVLSPASLICSMEISKYLTNSVRTSGVERWDLVRCSPSIEGVDAFEASILVDALKTYDSSSDLFWEKWSKKSPSLAKILWPAVQQLAIHRAYFAIPELLKHAASNPPEKELAQLITTTCLQAGIDQSLRELAKQEFNEARISAQWAKTFGTSPELEALENSIQDGLASLSDTLK